MSVFRIGLAIILLSLASQAQAGGLYIQEFGTPSHATASAAGQSLASDASTALHNPAGMTRLDDHALMGTGGLLVTDIEFDAAPTTPFPGSGNGGQQGGLAPVLGLHYVHNLVDRPDAEWFDRFRFGLSVGSISGAILDPSNLWAGRYEVQELSLVTLGVMPSVAVRVHEKFSIAAGVNMMYAHMEYDVGAPPGGPGQVQMDDLSDFKPGAIVSALWEPREDTRVGVLWQQEIELKLSGTIGFAGGAGPGDVALKLQMPFAQAVRASVLHEITPNLWLAGSFRWEDWSTFQEQWVFFPGFSTQLIRGWDDTFGGSLGLRWQFSNRWALLTGVGYDSSPVNASFRTADLPVDRQIRVAVGTQYDWSENTVIGFNFSYANLGDATIASDTLTGQYDDNDLYAVAFYVGWKRLPWSRLAK